MNTIIKKGLQSLLLVPVLALSVAVAAPVFQPSIANAQIGAGVNATSNAAKTGNVTSADDLITTVINIFLYIIGAVSVIMIIYGGFKYVTSGGDSSGVTSAKNTILYAVIGLVVAVFAYIIVHFVLDKLGVQTNP